jgi:hypothetical protein
LSERECIPLFPADEIPRILNLVLEHTETLHKLRETELEDELSDRLCKRLRIDRRIRSCPFSIHREFRVFDENIDEAGHRGRIDICFVCAGGDGTYFAIEAKRLHVTFQKGGWKSLVGEYVVGDQGMMCFVTGKYSPLQQAGAMLGYVFDGGIQKARSRISDVIDKNRAILRISDPAGLVRSDIIEGSACVDETRHLFCQRPFMIYHLLVSVQTP